MVLVDGRTDKEKLFELLQSSERPNLEFKSRLDFGDFHVGLNFVKDAVSMMNRPPGGYILVGVSDDGNPCLPKGSLDPRLFDSAALNDRIRKYIEAETHVYAQIHVIDDHEVALICIPQPTDLLPIPMAKIGQFDNENGKKSTVVFRQVDIFVREGAQNVPIRYSHWATLLSDRDKRIQHSTRELTDSLIADLAAAIKDSGINGVLLPPLDADMNNSSFAEALVPYLERDKPRRLKQLLRQLSAVANNQSRSTMALDKMTIVACQATYFEKDIVAQRAIDTLYDTYAKYSKHSAQLGLDIIDRVYILGSLAVRLGNWSALPDLVLRTYPQASETYRYSSWIRHGQVEASQSNLFDDSERGLMISRGRHLVRSESAMRPDIPDAALTDKNELSGDDPLLNSLCQFDILYCLIVATLGSEHGGGYTAASAFKQERSDPAFELVSTHADIRNTLFARSTESEIANVISSVYNTAKAESHGDRGSQWWWHLPEAAERFIEEHSS